MAVRTWTGATTNGDWGNTGNWFEGSVPVNSDDVVFRNNTQPVTTGFNQSLVTLASLTIDQTYTGTLGDATNYLRVSATSLRIGAPSQTPGVVANGSQRIKLDLGAAQTTAVIINTCTGSADGGLPPVQLLGTHASNSLTVMAGQAGVAVVLDSEISTVATLNVSGTGATVFTGKGTTLTTINQNGGNLTINSAATTVSNVAGTFTSQGSGAITTANITGNANLNSTGTITTLNVYSGGRANFTADPRARTIATAKLYKGATILYDPAVITVSNPMQLVGGTTEDVTITTPPGRTVVIA
jgi:hypothetical protein